MSDQCQLDFLYASFQLQSFFSFFYLKVFLLQSLRKHLQACFFGVHFYNAYVALAQ
jgi:hypothetical protein